MCAERYAVAGACTAAGRPHPLATCTFAWLITHQIQTNLLSINKAMSYSCEKWRRNAYSRGIRWRMLRQKESIGKTLDEVAQNLYIDKATVSSTLSSFHMTQSLKKKPHPKDKAFRKLTVSCQFFIVNLSSDRGQGYICVSYRTNWSLCWRLKYPCQ